MSKNKSFDKRPVQAWGDGVAKITGKTELTGVLGWPVRHSSSPAMHNAAATNLGLDLAYVPLPVRPENLEAAVRGLSALGFRGVNVTVPHKEAVIPYLDEIDPAADAIGAVNTILFQAPVEGRPRSVGYNTDWTGFQEDMVALSVSIEGEVCLVLGAGGAARAVSYALASTGGQVHVVARRTEQALQLMADLAARFAAGQLSHHPWKRLPETAARLAPALIVNCTPVGLDPGVEASPWPLGQPIPRGAFVYDLIYNPAETRLLQQARTAGCRVSNGRGMLVHQGAQAFKLWTGREADTQVMADALL